TVTGFTMLLINVFALAIGTVVIGMLADHLKRAGSAAPLTGVLFVNDVLAISSALWFALAARASGRQRVASTKNVQPVRP
ncbi:MFS transporter, partial [Paraburkholderia sp. EG286B]